MTLTLTPEQRSLLFFLVGQFRAQQLDEARTFADQSEFMCQQCLKDAEMAKDIIGLIDNS